MGFSKRGHKGKVDGNQTDIVKALVKCGYSVRSMASVGDGFPDLLVGVQSLNILLEVKMPKGKLRAKQTAFRDGWHGQCATVTSAEDAVKMVQTIVKANWEQ